MKKYNKVYVPDPDGPYEVEEVGGAWMDSVSILFAPPNSLIVLTLEELRELWMIAKESGAKLMIPGTKITNVFHFEAYLQSKGIEL